MNPVTRAGLLLLLTLGSLWGGGSVLAGRDQFAEDYRVCPPGLRLEALSGVRVRTGAMEQLIVEWESLDPDAWGLPGTTAAITVVTDAPLSLKQDQDLDATRAVFDDLDYFNHVWTFKVAVTDRGAVISEVVSRSFPFGDDKPGSQSRDTDHTAEAAKSANDGASEPRSSVVYFETSEAFVTEGRSLPVKVRLNSAPQQAVTLPLITKHQGGTSSDDYSGVPSSLTFDRGETSETFTIQGTADHTEETGEGLVLSFGTLPAGLTASVGTLTIALEDPTAYTGSGEAAGQVEFTDGTAGNPRQLTRSMTLTRPVLTVTADTTTYYILVQNNNIFWHEARWNPTDSNEINKPVHNISGRIIDHINSACQEEPFSSQEITSRITTSGDAPAFLEEVPTGSAGGTWDIYLIVEWGTVKAGLCNAANPEVPNIDITVDRTETRVAQLSVG